LRAQTELKPTNILTVDPAMHDTFLGAREQRKEVLTYGHGPDFKGQCLSACSNTVTPTVINVPNPNSRPLLVNSPGPFALAFPRLPYRS
jgi:hypothetical protein